MTGKGEDAYATGFPGIFDTLRSLFFAGDSAAPVSEGPLPPAGLSAGAAARWRFPAAEPRVSASVSESTRSIISAPAEQVAPRTSSGLPRAAGRDCPPAPAGADWSPMPAGFGRASTREGGPSPSFSPLVAAASPSPPAAEPEAASVGQGGTGGLLARPRPPGGGRAARRIRSSSAGPSHQI